LIRFYNFLNEHKTKFVYAPLILYWVILLLATSLPTDFLPEKPFDFFDKDEHFTAYGILGFLFALSLHFQSRIKLFAEKYFISTIIICGTYGLLDEIHQLFIPGRYCDLADWLADMVGILCGTLVARLIISNKLNIIVENGTNI